ncbi:hypothetical protein [Roseimarinus sediminis]|uniref:hypothetical protein n=1 Tax=Roseimarinus sediminis TaxID=1610899 RepID=UPI003D1B85D5
MEDLIPILIIIAISIIGSLGRKKKKRIFDGESVSSPHQKQDDNLFGWLERLAVDEDEQSIPYSNQKAYAEVEEEVAAKAEKPVAVPVETMTEQIKNAYAKHTGFITPEEKEKLVNQEGISSIKRTAFAGDLTAEKSAYNDEVLREDELFDARKAVIYSEILNRKYV